MAKDFNYKIDSSWTLFIDRDGVINNRIIDGYVKNINELKIDDIFLNIYSSLRLFFHRVFIVTNQRGIALGLMNENDLTLIHNHLINILEHGGGKPDKIYYCPHDKNTCECRKPKPGMAYSAKNDFPEIEFSKSIMIGDSESDMVFGNNLGMLSVRYPDNNDHSGDLSIDQFLHLLRSGK